MGGKVAVPIFPLDRRIRTGCAIPAGRKQPEENSEARLHPWHSSTIGWQPPPLKEQPFFVIKMHSKVSFTVVQTIGITPFPFDDFANRKHKT
jgi:hypothetical protein